MNSVNKGFDIKIFHYKDGHQNFPLPVLSETCAYNKLKIKLSKSKHRCALLVDKNSKIKNFITQGDLLRFECTENSLETRNLLKFKPDFISALNSSLALEIMDKDNLSVVPLKTLSGKITGILVRSLKTNTTKFEPSQDPKKIAIVMVGGKGIRLAPITDSTPKPLIKINGKCLVEYVMSSLKYLGFTEFNLLCQYLPNSFKEFSKKTKFRTNLYFEKEPLGTGGPLLKWIQDNHLYLENKIKRLKSLTLIIANGDLIFDIDKDTLSHFEKGSHKLCIVARNHETQIKYGTLEEDDSGFLREFREKPIMNHLVNTGVYLINMDILVLKKLISFGIVTIGMPDLIMKLANSLKCNIKVMKISGNYLDLGTHEDLEKLKNALGGNII